MRRQDRPQLLPHKARDKRTSRGSRWTCSSPLRGCQDSRLSAPGRVSHEPLSFWASAEAVWGGWAQPMTVSGAATPPPGPAAHPGCLPTLQAPSWECAAPNTLPGPDMSSSCHAESDFQLPGASTQRVLRSSHPGKVTCVQMDPGHTRQRDASLVVRRERWPGHIYHPGF